jgi:hypothetical protein
MQLDIRIPLGLLFAIVGAMLAIFGTVSDGAAGAHTAGLNIDLWWGLAMAAFGGLMLWLARR